MKFLIALKHWLHQHGVIGIGSRQLLVFALGFSSGLPLLLTGSVLQTWMRREGIDLTSIGLVALVGLPYSFKFLWAPLLDAIRPPFWGRRRGWLLLVQLALMAAIWFLGQGNPAAHVEQMFLLAIVVTFFSATQDILIDAWRREILLEDEQGLGAGMNVNGYRLGMLVASGGGLIVAGEYSYAIAYQLMSLCVIVGMIATWLAPESEVMQVARRHGVIAIFVDPLREFFHRMGPTAFWVLLFILMYKIGDAMAANMTNAFYVDQGFSDQEIGATVKLFGSSALLVGALLGGVLMLRLSLWTALFYFGLLQMVSTLGFGWLSVVGNQLWALAVVVAFENLASGMGTAAYLAFMARLTDRRFTATQFALLSSLMSLPRVVFSAMTGPMALYLGWWGFFVACTLLAVPGLLLLVVLKSRLAPFGLWSRPEHHMG